jgi:isoleucyl-tRNA synthetase
MSDVKDYKETLNLPQTDFPMKANLPEKEPEQLKEWEKISLYEKIIDKNSSKKKYLLHDGPPYANGNIHMGTALNKVLKDIVVRYKNMNGFCAPYVPGWDCHGLPIELQVEKKFGKASSAEQTISRCREYAHEFINKQRETFKRLGVYGEWNDPYLTMNKEYEAGIMRELSRTVKTGAVYRADKPVYWCADCVTALAEAEVEYKDHSSPSVFVKFKAEEKLKQKLGVKDSELFVVIWTTTPWTLPANLAITLHPEFNYGVYNSKTKKESLLIAEELFEKFISETKQTDEFKKITTIKGAELENFKCKHPFIDRDSIIILGDHVTLETGTGCVHTAPGHGVEDYIVGKKYGLDIYNPVDDHGCFYKDAPVFAGIKVKDANDKIIELIKNNDSLIYTAKVSHSYPHCWRCKQPIIFRATPQWFISMEKTGLRKKALSEIEKVKWTPEKGMKRIYSMVENRPDWCISRQRIWGVPIPAFQCKKCGNIILESTVIDHVANMVEKEGIEAWHKHSAQDLLPNGTTCTCGSSDFNKGKDILDVWFDSGVSHATVCEANKKLGSDIDLYLEGSDQHRGWFHTSLLESTLTRGKAPYKQVVTHGFIVDKSGYKMSKSLGNVVDPSDLIKKSGADILRLWVAYENFSEDISYSEESYVRVTEAYRRIRNTFRFILGNLFDYDNKKNAVPKDKLRSIDQWLLHKLATLNQDVKQAYDNFEFYKVFQLVHNFCSVELSSFYLDIAKDALYTNKKDSVERRGIQTVMYAALDTIVKLMSPIIPFTTEETWKYMNKGNSNSIHTECMPEAITADVNKDLDDIWTKILSLRESVSKLLEEKRKNKEIGHSLDADVTLELPDNIYEAVTQTKMDLSNIFIVSNVAVKKGSELKIEANKSSFGKCARCWQYKEEVGKLGGNKEICKRCLDAIS